MRPSAQPREITISPAMVLRSLTVVIVTLVVLHLAVQIGEFRFGRDHLMGLTPLLDLDREYNLPTWYSGAALIATALALGVVALGTHQSGAPYVRHWTVLALIFLYLSFDELARVHENWSAIVSGPMADWIPAGARDGALRHRWIIPAAVLVVAVGLSYLRFLWHLPARTRWLFIVSGGLFVGGAIGMEMVGSTFAASVGQRTFAFEVLVAIEEGLEMISIALFLYAILGYLATTFAPVRITGAMPATQLSPLSARRVAPGGRSASELRQEPANPPRNEPG